jgi:alpha-beta hydrolase superfamily lysophospholipase
MDRRPLILLTAAVVLLVAASAAAGQSVPITIRGKSLTLAYYAPQTGAPKGTVFMGSGDVGWVGLGVDLAEFLSRQGYAVVGINVRQYLSAFTSGKSHVEPAQVAGDYAAIAQLMRTRGTLPQPVIVSGVSEGAALAVLAAADAANHSWIKGVITMGLPPTAELAWRWSDAASWITKRDPDEPSFEPKTFIASISPLPLWMIQSSKDEYVTEKDYRMFERVARPPKRLVLIDASNHRFTNRLEELRKQFLAGLAWIQSPTSDHQAPVSDHQLFS